MVCEKGWLSTATSTCVSSFLYCNRFLPRDAMHPRYFPWACVCVCLCLCPSVTSQCSTKTAKGRITQRTPHDRPGNLVFLTRKMSAKFDWGHPVRGREMQLGWVKISDFRQALRGYSAIAELLVNEEVIRAIDRVKFCFC